MADRARYFLEQSLPELLDLQEKKIFTTTEIKAITRQRITFEEALARKVLRKADFLRYAEYEINLEALRVQRVKRLQIKGKKSISDWAGPRRIFFIFERALRRFQGDVDLWLQYIEYAKRQKSNSKLGQAYTAVLQLHPTNPTLWSLASQHEAQWNGNMTAARRLMQRGLRLNQSEPKLWIDYLQLEVDYLDKIYARRRVLGLDGARSDKDDDEELKGFDALSQPASVLTGTGAEDHDSTNDSSSALIDDVKMSTLSTTSTNLALQGAIPLAILRAATQALPGNLEMLFSFHKVVSDFDHLPIRDTMLTSIVSHLDIESLKTDPYAAYLRTILPMALLQSDVHLPQFPAALKKSIELYEQASKQVTSLPELVNHWTTYLVENLLSASGLEASLKTAITLTVRKAFKDCPQLSPVSYGAWINFEKAYGNHASVVLADARRKYPGVEHFAV